MKPKFKLLLLTCIIAANAHAQTKHHRFSKIGDPAPALRVKQWIKGKPVTHFQKGTVYIVEFWATWCQPCMASMPHLSDLARKYKGKLNVVAISVYEEKGTTLKQVKAVVEKMGTKMDFNVATEDPRFTVHDWLVNWNVKNDGIPKTFIVNVQGQMAWIGEPHNADEVLKKAVANTWGAKDIKELATQKKFNKYLSDLDESIYSKIEMVEIPSDDPTKLSKYVLANPDSELLAVEELVRKEPRLKYAPHVASHTFEALLHIDPHRAYEYGKKVIVTPTYDTPAYDAIINNIRDYTGKINIPAEIYLLGVEAYQALIDHDIYPQLSDMPKRYRTIAAWYRLANDEANALEAEQKAVAFSTK
ncbi:MAG: TlpA disulfide reductase family protein [Bacteroidota bacterium]